MDIISNIVDIVDRIAPYRDTDNRLQVLVTLLKINLPVIEGLNSILKDEIEAERTIKEFGHIVNKILNFLKTYENVSKAKKTILHLVYLKEIISLSERLQLCVNTLSLYQCETTQQHRLLDWVKKSKMSNSKM